MNMKRIMSGAFALSLLSTASFAALAGQTSDNSNAFAVTAAIPQRVSLSDLSSPTLDISESIGLGSDAIGSATTIPQAVSGLKIGAIAIFSNSAGGYELTLSTTEVDANGDATGNLSLTTSGTAVSGFSDVIEVTAVKFAGSTFNSTKLVNGVYSTGTVTGQINDTKDVTLDIAAGSNPLISGTYSQTYQFTITAK